MDFVGIIFDNSIWKGEGKQRTYFSPLDVNLKKGKKADFFAFFWYVHILEVCYFTL
jgi:hypothetical protein